MIDRIKAHTEQELITIFKQEGCPEKFISKFISLYNSSFEELKKEYGKYCEDDYKEGDEDTAQADALMVTMIRLERFIAQINIGHGEEWATLIGNNPDDYSDHNVWDAYWSLRKIDKELAKKEIQIHSKSFGEDALFEKHYSYLFENGGSMDCPQEVARKYSRIYKQQTEQGKSEIYADKYAMYMSFDKDNSLCEQSAIAYEKAILEGIDELDASLLAEDYGEAIANGYYLDFLSKYSDTKQIPYMTNKELEEFILRKALNSLKEKM
jgi:hypothetical protein